MLLAGEVSRQVPVDQDIANHPVIHLPESVMEIALRMHYLSKASVIAPGLSMKAPSETMNRVLSVYWNCVSIVRRRIGIIMLSEMYSRSSEKSSLLSLLRSRQLSVPRVWT
jgi:hypothetical protein